LGLATSSTDQQKHWDKAFDAFVREMIEAAKSKPATLVRSVGLIYGFLINLPIDAVTKYAQRIKDKWQQARLDLSHPAVMRMCDDAIRYRPLMEPSE
jgi:hypothetical protein